MVCELYLNKAVLFKKSSIMGMIVARFLSRPVVGISDSQGLFK